MALQPTLIVVTGRPASGKTTFSCRLEQLILGAPSTCTAGLEVVRRDDVKQSYLAKLKLSHADAPDTINQTATKIFMEEVVHHLRRGVCVLIDAAFQHGLWENFLCEVADFATIKMIVCDVSAETALIRYESRLGVDDHWRHVHGVEIPHHLIQQYQAPRLDYPCLTLDMERDQADLSEVMRFIDRGN